MTLQEATERALGANRGIRGARRTVEARGAGLEAARGHFLPQVQIDAVFTYLDEDMILNLEPIRDAVLALDVGNQEALSNLESLITQGRPLTDAERVAVRSGAAAQLDQAVPHFTEVLKKQAFLQGAVTARQPLFTGGRIMAGVRAARARQEGAEAALAGQEEEVRAETAKRYLDVLLATENLRLREGAVRTLTRHRDRAARLLEEGVIPLHEKMRADVALAEAERARFSAGQLLRIAETALASSLGEESLTEAVADSFRYRPPPSVLDDLMAAMEGKNATLRQLRAGTQALEERARAERASLFPTIYGFGMYNLFDDYMITDAEPKWAVGIGASFTLLDGASQRRAWTEARLEAEAMEDAAQEARRKLRLLLQSTHMQMALAQEQYRRLKAALSQAQENLRLNSRRFDEGLGTSLEVIDAQLSLDAVLLQRAAALHSFYSRQVDIFRLTGGMDRFLGEWDAIQGQDAA